MRFDLPMRLPSAANLREHWAVRVKRVAAQRAAVRLGCAKLWWLGKEAKGTEHYVVTLTRGSQRALDSDNLQGAFKAMRDEVAALLRLDDNSPRVAWVYRQTKTPRWGYFVAIEVEVVRAQRDVA